jgi:hypothetical protein
LTTTEEITTEKLITTTTRTTTPQQENQCRGANHLHRVDDCTKFLWIYENNSRIISCSQGLAWNDLTKRCDEHSLFQCLSGIYAINY